MRFGIAFDVPLVMDETWGTWGDIVPGLKRDL
jgi:hypothetical protein